MAAAPLPYILWGGDARTDFGLKKLRRNSIFRQINRSRGRFFHYFLHKSSKKFK